MKTPNAPLLSIAVAAMLAMTACAYLDDASTGADQNAASGPEPIAGAEAATVAAFIETVPSVEDPDFDLEMALTLAAMPLSCLDRPHAAPRDRSAYLDEFVAARRPGYERDRSFYGCWDWHSAVNSTWALVKIYKEYPGLPVAGLITEKLRDHLAARALEGELEFFSGNATFERPYGWAWTLKLYAELRTWDHADAQHWADNLEPLARLFSERTVAYLPGLDRPSRSGAHSNTAFALAMMLDYARSMDETELEDAIEEAALRLFGEDTGCPTAYEPWGSDFLSPCLEEAALMAVVLEADAFGAWFEDFMPAVHAPEFLPLTTPVDASETNDVIETPADAAEPGSVVAADDPDEGASSSVGSPAGDPGTADTAAVPGESDPVADAAVGQREAAERAAENLRSLASRSHLIGLAFVRADAMNRIADALPPGDSRAAAYRKLAALHGSMGFEAMFDADYAGSHWIGTFALKYLMTSRTE